MWYCEVRPNYSFLKKAGQFKKLYEVRRFEKFCEFVNLGGSESANDAKVFLNGPVSRSFLNYPAFSRNE